jgi:hypothetical protein
MIDPWSCVHATSVHNSPAVLQTATVKWTVSLERFASSAMVRSVLQSASCAMRARLDGYNDIWFGRGINHLCRAESCLNQNQEDVTIQSLLRDGTRRQLQTVRRPAIDALFLRHRGR